MVLMGNPTYGHKMDKAASADAASTLHDDRSLQATEPMMPRATLHPRLVVCSTIVSWCVLPFDCLHHTRKSHYSHRCSIAVDLPLGRSVKAPDNVIFKLGDTKSARVTCIRHEIVEFVGAYPHQTQPFDLGEGEKGHNAASDAHRNQVLQL